MLPVQNCCYFECQAVVRVFCLKIEIHSLQDIDSAIVCIQMYKEILSVKILSVKLLSVKEGKILFESWKYQYVVTVQLFLPRWQLYLTQVHSVMCAIC